MTLLVQKDKNFSESYFLLLPNFRICRAVHTATEMEEHFYLFLSLNLYYLLAKKSITVLMKLINCTFVIIVRYLFGQKINTIAEAAFLRTDSSIAIQ